MAERVRPPFNESTMSSFFEGVKSIKKIPERDAHFRNYDLAPEHVKDFYQKNHQNQTYQYVLDREAEYSAQESRTLVMPMMDMLIISGELRDESDPDNDHPQIVHALQSAISVREKKGPEWLEVTALVHDVGKLLGTSILSEDPKNPRPPLPQWAVVGDTFPVGCAFSENIVFYDFFKDDPQGRWKGNPDTYNPEFNTPYGIYPEHVGLDKLKISFSHDGYLHDVLKGESNLPQAALDMIRYHSLYPVHRKGDYIDHLISKDKKAIGAAIGFNTHDLYSKDQEVPDEKEIVKELNHYKPLIEKYIPKPLHW